MILSGLKYIAGRLSRSIAVVATAVALTLVSCGQDTPDTPTGEDQAGIVTFRVLTYKTDGIASRATWGDEYPDDSGNAFDNKLLGDQLKVVITDNSCNVKYFVTSLICVSTSQTPETVTYNYIGRLDKDDVNKVKAEIGEGKLHVIANAGSDAQLDDDAAFSHYGQPDANFTAIPMWGVTSCDFSKIELGTSFDADEVSLLRSMAKVVIDLSENEDNYIDKLKTVRVSAVNTKGYLLPKGWIGVRDTKSLNRNAVRIPEQQTIHDVAYNFNNNRVEFYLPEIENNADNEIALNLTFDTKFDQDTPKDKTEFVFTEQWSQINSKYNDGWDSYPPNWYSAIAIKATACPRFATVLKGHLYTVNMKTMSIMEIDENGAHDVYKLPSLKDRKFKAVVNNSQVEKEDYYGTAISHDDAGNLLIGHYFTYDLSAYIWTVYNPETGEAQHVKLDLPSGYTPARIDCVGRVEGDLTKKAVVHIAPSASNQVLNVTFTGNGTVGSITATCTTTTAEIMSTTAFCQPTGIGAFAYYSKKDNGIYNINSTTGSKEFTAFKNNANTNGLETFVLGGERYYVVNYLSESSTTNSSPMDIAVIDEDGKICAIWNNPNYNSTLGYSSIAVEPVDDNNVDIFVYNCTSKLNGGSGAIAGAKLRLSLLHSDISGETSCERTGTLYFRPYANGDPDTTKSRYDIRRNYLYHYTVNMMKHLSAVVEVVPYVSVELDPDFGFDEPLPRPPSEWVTPPWVEIGQ